MKKLTLEKYDYPHFREVNVRLEFEYNARGFGNLRLLDGDRVVDDLMCRTGSIDKSGQLVNPIGPDTWYILSESVDTNEIGMYIHEGEGWKIRLYRRDVLSGEFQYTHYLIHPDGGLPGSKGCIVIQGSDALSFRHELDAAVRDYARIPVIVRAA